MLTVEEAAAVARISRRQAYVLANQYLNATNGVPRQDAVVIEHGGPSSDVASP
jgi:hypothetical protein